MKETVNEMKKSSSSTRKEEARLENVCGSPMEESSVKARQEQIFFEEWKINWDEAFKSNDLELLDEQLEVFKNRTSLDLEAMDKYWEALSRRFIKICSKFYHEESEFDMAALQRLVLFKREESPLDQQKKKKQTRLDVHEDGDVAFINACCSGYLEVVKFLTTSKDLLDSGHGWVMDQETKEKGLMIACEYGNLNIIEYLLTSKEMKMAGNPVIEIKDTYEGLRGLDFILMYNFKDVIDWLFKDYGLKWTPSVICMVQESGNKNALHQWDKENARKENEMLMSNLQSMKVQKIDKNEGDEKGLILQSGERVEGSVTHSKKPKNKRL